ncbi:MAG: exodeoxyribonuclease VII large subunit [Chitinispirillales bacterium]|jgi:exodeoxyribonuclease VII large subunit|nr:exodeoxyribonuclease VII large subunit [Chitinispirillales bacterium]
MADHNNITYYEDNDYDDNDDGGFDFLTPQESDEPYTITEINAGIAQILGERNTLVWVEGEISGWKSYPSGHCYFKLMDENSQIPGVMWKSAAVKLDFEPNDSMAVFAVASISVYEKNGYYQLNVHRMMPAGKGALHLAFEKLKEKLRKEGLFDDSHKKTLPRSVSTLGVVTSKSGAALWDIVSVVAKRAPQTDIVIIDTAVQGDKAAGQIAKSIKAMNDYGQVDLMIVGRGGGSAEDLWAFNEEAVARAIHESRIPIISAVGHEIDFTIADFAADVRAPTPSAAAEIAVPDTKESSRHFQLCGERFIRAFAEYFGDINDRIGRIKSSRAMSLPFRILQNAEQSFDEAGERFGRAMRLSMRSMDEKVKTTAKRLNALSPLAVLARGYSVVQDSKGAVIKSVNSIELGDIVKIRLADGSADALVTSF